MPGVCKIGDINQTGGSVIDGVNDVIVNGQPIAVIGSKISPHAPWGRPHPPHDAAVITSGSSDVIAGGRAVATLGSANSCGHSMASASGDVNAG